MPDTLADFRGKIELALRNRDRGKAASLLQDLLAAYPENADTWAIDSDVSLAFGDFTRALTSAERAGDLGVPSAANHLRRARALRALGHWSGVESAIHSAAMAAGSVALSHAQIGNFLSAMEDYRGALSEYNEALRLDPENPAYLFNRAAVRRFLGDFAGAEADYDRVIIATPHDAEAHFNRSELRAQTLDRNHVTELRREIARTGLPWLDEVRLSFALAKELEDLGLYSESWRQLESGATLRRRHLKYDVAVDVATVDWIIEAYPTSPPQETLLAPDGPIFIVGMPRTGSTLLERMLSAHSKVNSAGERQDFAELVVAAARNAGANVSDRRGLIEASASIDFRALGQEYLKRLYRLAADRPRLIDKMPLNYLYCGLIRRALPQARILHMTRQPLATCYSMYKMLFNQAYPFSYSLSEIGAYYIGYRRLMDYWCKTVEGQILDVSYEDLVLHPEATLRGVLAFCGLDWEPGCLEYQNLDKATSTASASQVRRPIYQRSIDLWRRYTTQLEPLAAQLAAAGIIESPPAA